MKVLRQLDEVLDPGAWDKPIFATNEQKPEEAEQSSSNLAIFVSLRNGAFDGYFNSDRKLSQLYQESLTPSSLPSVKLISSDFETSANRVLPTYPPIAKAALVEGIVETTFDVSPSGNTSNVQRVSGPKLMEKATTDAILQWTFPPSSEIRHTHAKIAFRLNCRSPRL
jgi:outer membrane biosynthesis protein TonB